MKKELIYAILLIYLLKMANVTNAQITDYIKLEGKQFMYQNGAPFFPIVMNYNASILHDNASPIPNFKPVRTPAYGSKGCDYFEGYTWANCKESLGHDFKKIKEMGFNTIRLILTPSRKDGSLGFKFQSNWFNDVCDISNTTNYMFDFPSNNYNSPDAIAFFTIIEEVIEIADDNGLYVIYLCSDHSKAQFDDRFTSYADANDYANFLRALASHLQGKEALLAYDLYNEPGLNWWKHNISQPQKSEICNYVSMWYDAIHDNDDNHLITLGGTDFGDAISYDGSVMKLDFISMHLYTDTKVFEGFDQSKMINRLLDLIYWCSNALQRPWIIGEMGYTSSPDACINDEYDFIHGDYSQQAAFVSAVLPAIRDCGVSGFSWWCFQDLHYNCIPPLWGCTAVTNELICTGNFPEDEQVGQNYFGLLEYGDQDFVSGQLNSGYYPDILEKPAVNVIDSFDFTTLGTCTLPTNQYYNPFGHPSHPNEISGVVINEMTGQPIEFAVISAKTTIGTAANGKLIEHWNYSFTNENGEFTSSPYDYLPLSSPNTTTIEKLEIGAMGAEAIYSNSPYTLLWLHELKRDFFPYDENISNKILFNGDFEEFRGYNKLVVGNSVEFKSGSSAELSARQEIHLTDELLAKSGSEVHAFIDEYMFPECTDYTGYKQINIPPNNPHLEVLKPSDIDIKFRNYLTEFRIFVSPNPVSSTFIFGSESHDLTNCGYELYSKEGKLVLQGKHHFYPATVNMESVTSGVFTLVVINKQGDKAVAKVVKY